MHRKTSIAQQYTTPQGIYDAVCPVCKDNLYVTYRHIGGYARKQPHVACTNLDGGEAHHLVRISEGLERHWFDFLEGVYKANEIWAETLEAELTEEVAR